MCQVTIERSEEGIQHIVITALLLETMAWLEMEALLTTFTLLAGIFASSGRAQHLEYLCDTNVTGG